MRTVVSSLMAARAAFVRAVAFALDPLGPFRPIPSSRSGGGGGAAAAAFGAARRPVRVTLWRLPAAVALPFVCCCGGPGGTLLGQRGGGAICGRSGRWCRERFGWTDMRAMLVGENRAAVGRGVRRATCRVVQRLSSSHCCQAPTATFSWKRRRSLQATASSSKKKKKTSNCEYNTRIFAWNLWRLTVEWVVLPPFRLGLVQC